MPMAPQSSGQEQVLPASDAGQEKGVAIKAMTANAGRRPTSQQGLRRQKRPGAVCCVCSQQFVSTEQSSEPPGHVLRSTSLCCPFVLMIPERSKELYENKKSKENIWRISLSQLRSTGSLHPAASATTTHGPPDHAQIAVPDPA